MAGWHIDGQYMETCNCNFLCPCITSNLTAMPTEGDCKAAIALRIDKGEKDGVSLDGISFIVLMYSPGAMSDGNFTVGLIIDEKADEAQTAAVGEIASGAVGGPMAALAPLVGTLAGVEKRPITFEQEGMTFTVTAGELIDQACEGVAGVARPGEPIYVDNVAHPANATLALAKATRSHFDAFGIQWADASGTRNGHFAAFSWSG